MFSHPWLAVLVCASRSLPHPRPARSPGREPRTQGFKILLLFTTLQDCHFSLLGHLPLGWPSFLGGWMAEFRDCFLDVTFTTMSGTFGTTRPSRWRDQDLIEHHTQIRAGGVTSAALTIVAGGREHTIAVVREWSFGRRRIARPWLVCPDCLQRRRYLYEKAASSHASAAPARERLQASLALVGARPRSQAASTHRCCRPFAWDPIAAASAATLYPRALRPPRGRDRKAEEQVRASVVRAIGDLEARARRGKR